MIHYIHGNYIGFIICALAFGIAFGVGYLLGIGGEGPLMVIAGPLVMTFDLTYRLFAKDGHWIDPQRGGSLFFIPLWCLGALWLVLGVAYTLGWA
jgi:hypothetical protein